MNYWLVKQEPDDYSWADFVRDGGTAWTGIRNFAARNHLRAMRTGDQAIFYHSGDDKMVVGLARVVREAYPDATADEGDWSAVDLEPARSLALPVTLGTIKKDALLKTMPLVKQTRLSVSPVTDAQFKRLMELGQTRA